MRKERVRSVSALGFAAVVASTAGIGSAMVVPQEALADEDVQEDCRIWTSRDVSIVNWYAEEPQPPKTMYQEDLRDYREQIQKDYNFTIHVDNIGGYGESYTTKLSSSITRGFPVGDICEVKPEWFLGLYNNKLCAPLDTMKDDSGFKRSLLQDEKWNRSVLEATTFDGHIYGMAVGHNPGAGIFFNKRLLQEAGYSADELYDFQKNGTWTWSKFEEVLKACTRDTDHDGDIDTWGMVSFNSDYYTTAIYASGGQFVSKDANGHFQNEMGSDEFLNIVNWVNDMWHKYSEPQPEGSDWEYYKACFNNGEAAMRIGEESAKNELDGLKDDWGFVMFPCPDGREPIAVESENIFFIPASYSEEEVSAIGFCFDLYTDPVPGYEDDEAWKEDYYSTYKDTRAVDETLSLMRKGKVSQRLDLYVGEFQDFLGAGFIWDSACGMITPKEAIENQMPFWNAAISGRNDGLDNVRNAPIASQVGDTMPIVIFAVLAFASGTVLVSLRKKKA